MAAAEQHDGGSGGAFTDWRAPAPYNVRLLSRAVREGWNIPPELRQEVVDALAEGMRHAPTAAVRVSAAKALGMLYGQNIKLMGLDDRKDQSELQAKLASLRAALATPEGRAALCADADRLSQPTDARTPPLVAGQEGGAGPLT